MNANKLSGFLVSCTTTSGKVHKIVIIPQDILRYKRRKPLKLISGFRRFSLTSYLLF